MIQIRRVVEPGPAAIQALAALLQDVVHGVATAAPRRVSSRRSRRVCTAIDWLAEGRPRNWKYNRGTARKSASARPAGDGRSP
jgi:hypothetical protein